MIVLLSEFNLRSHKELVKIKVAKRVKMRPPPRSLKIPLLWFLKRSHLRFLKRPQHYKLIQTFNLQYL